MIVDVVSASTRRLRGWRCRFLAVDRASMAAHRREMTQCELQTSKKTHWTRLISAQNITGLSLE